MPPKVGGRNRTSAGSALGKGTAQEKKTRAPSLEKDTSIMTITNEELPILTRPQSKAEQADLISTTQSFMDKAARKSQSSFGDMDKFNRKAAIYFVQAAYGFYIIQELCRNENQWRKIIFKYFPKISMKRAIVISHIGEYFNFTVHYLEFLDAINYPIKPDKRHTEDIEVQLKRLEQADPPLIDVSMHGLEEYFRVVRPGNGKNNPEVAASPEPVPVAVSDEFSAEGTGTVPIPNSDETLGAETSPVTEPAIPEEPEAETLFNEEDLHFDKLLDEFAGKISLPTNTVQVFTMLKNKRPTNQWNPAKVSRIREVLLPAKLILDELG